MFQHKKKKTSGETPKYRLPAKPPIVGEGIPKQPCLYETPCGWCTKWDKKCDKKIPSLYEYYDPELIKATIDAVKAELAAYKKLSKESANEDKSK